MSDVEAKKPASDAEKAVSRTALLEAALEEFWTKGYHGTRVDEIVARTPFTKGAFYHHFDSKKSLAIAVIDEVIGAVLAQRWVVPLEGAEDPYGTLIGQLEATRKDDDEGVRRGCMLNNLAQELSHHDDEFREHLDAQFARWRTAFEDAIARGQALGQVRGDADPARLAAYIVASYEGAVSLAKAARSREVLGTVLEQLLEHLESYRLTR